MCGVAFNRPGQIRIYCYCSPACRGVARRIPEDKRRILTCEFCGESFTRRGTRPYRFCSVACRTAGQRSSRPTNDELRDLYVERKLTANDIAVIYGKDPKTTWSWLRQAGIETRTRGSYSEQQFKPGQVSAFKGKQHTPEFRAARRAERLVDGHVPYLVNGQHYMKGPKARVGADHPNWRGGISPERQQFYATREWKDAARAVWIRDNYTCQRCGVKPPSGGLKHNRGHVHHITSFRVRELRTELTNLILLCAECHRWVHSRKNKGRELIHV